METKEIIKPIGFLIQDKDIIVANPCTIPLEFMEKVIKDHKKAKLKKGEVAVCCLIMLPLNFRKRKNVKRSTTLHS